MAEFDNPSADVDGIQPAAEPTDAWSQDTDANMDTPDIDGPDETLSGVVDLVAEPQTKRSSSSAASNRSLIRRTASKAQELAGADAEHLELLGVVLSCGTGLSDLTTTVMTSSAKDAQSLSDALEILDSDQLEAGITAASLGRHRLRQLWKLFGALDVVSGDAPASDAKAAIALVRAVNSGGNADIAREQLESVSSLLKK